MDQATFDQLRARAKAKAEAAAQQQQPTAAPQQAAEAPQKPAQGGQSAPSGIAGVLGEAASVLAGGPLVGRVRQQLQDAVTGGSTPITEAPQDSAAMATGALKSIFETKDFLFGEPIDGQSDFRTEVESEDARLRGESMVNSVASGLGQFATAMIGLGKVTGAMKALPWFGSMLKAAPVATEVGQAAVAGAIAFDPHEERLSNLIQRTPLANPVNAWLAADPTDTAALGRVKAAMESIGIDAAFGAVLLGAGAVAKAIKWGDAEGAAKASSELEALISDRTDPEPEFGVDTNAGGPAEPLPPIEGAPKDVTQAEATGAGPEAAVSDQPQAAGPQAGLQDQAVGAGPTDNGSSVRGASVDGSPEQPVRPTSGEPTPQVVANATRGAEAAGAAPSSANRPRIQLSDEDTVALVDRIGADIKAMEDHGGWYAAIEAGHTFGKGAQVPWFKMETTNEVGDFTARVADVIEERMVRIKGGDVLGDEKVVKMVNAIASEWNKSPAQLLGMIQQAGKHASTMVANMEAAFSIGRAAMQDSYTLASRIRLGDAAVLEFGGVQGALQELRKRVNVAGSLLAAGKSMSANSARALRRMQFDPVDVGALKALGDEDLLDALVATKGNAKALKKVVDPSWWSRAGKGLEFLLINSLVSGPMTQFINTVTNGYMVLSRPAMRMGGALLTGQGPSSAAFRASLKQYTYMGGAFYDGFSQAGRAFLRNDSVLKPHSTEFAAPGGMLQQAVPWKPMTSVGGVLNNALHVAGLAVGLPTRLLGTVDELVKQTVYRSHVSANAFIEASDEAIAKGLTGRAYKDYTKSYVEKAMDNAFDAEGRATNPAAMREAVISTFQQELAPHSLGKTIQTGVQNYPLLRLVFPFVKTPTNVLREGWKLTPGLNMLQTEFRQALLSTDPAMQVAKAQAAGQMAMGTLFMGTAAFFVSSGQFTGGGPTDPKKKAELMATGWRPYSWVIEGDDGKKTYVQFGRVDPIAIPMGIIADVMDAMNVLGQSDDPAIEDVIGGLTVALAKQFTSKTYLQGVTQVMEAITQPDRKAETYVGQTLANLIPYSAALRQLNTDPYLRDARQMTDKLMATVPGLSDNLPARYDWLGDPVGTRKGLWSTEDELIIDHEIQRMIVERGESPLPPNPTYNGVNLKDLTLSDGRNAYEVLQQVAGHPPKGPSLAHTIARLMETERYANAPDGDRTVKGTKLYAIGTITEKYRERAMNYLKRDPAVKEALTKNILKAKQEFLAKKRGEKPKTNLYRLGEAFGFDLDDAIIGAP